MAAACFRYGEPLTREASVWPDGHRDHLVLAFETNAANARGVTPLEQAYVINGEADAAARSGGDKTLSMDARSPASPSATSTSGASPSPPAERQMATRTMHVALVELHRDLAVAVDALESLQGCFGARSPSGSRTLTAGRPSLVSSGSGRIDVMRSSCASGSRFTSALPGDCGVAAGRRHTFMRSTCRAMRRTARAYAWTR